MEFKEYMIKKERTALDFLVSALCYIVALSVGFIAMVLLLPYRMGGVALLALCGAVYGAHMLSSRRNKEFEYIMTDDNIDIDVVMNKERRKRLISFSVKEAEIIAPTDDERHRAQMNAEFAKKTDALSGRRDADTYFAIVDKNGERTLVLFEPTYAMLTSLQKYARSKIHIKNYN